MKIEEYLNDEDTKLLVDGKHLEKIVLKYSIKEKLALAYLRKYVFKKDIELGTINVFNYKQVIKQSELVNSKMEECVLVIGSLCNGDFVGIITKNGKVCYICHDEVLEAEEKVDQNDAMIIVAKNIEEYYDMIDDDDCPMDYYEAKEKMA